MALTAAGIALVAAAARAQTAQPEQVVLAPTVFASHGVPANAITTFRVTCPAGYVAVSAGVTSPAAGATVLAITPVGLSGYRFRIGNPATNGDQRITVSVACRKLRSGKLVLRLKPLKPKRLVVPPRSSAGAALVCPGGTTPANGGVDLQPKQGKALVGFAGTPLSVRRETTTLTRASYVVANSGSRARTVVVHGACLTLFRARGAPLERLHLALTTFRVPVHPGAQSVGRSCPSGWFALDAGYALLARPSSVTGAAVTAKGGHWSLEANGDAALLADLQLACGRVGP
jgi:hypothetical protein